VALDEILIPASIKRCLNSLTNLLCKRPSSWTCLSHVNKLYPARCPCPLGSVRICITPAQRHSRCKLRRGRRAHIFIGVASKSKRGTKDPRTNGPKYSKKPRRYSQDERGEANSTGNRQTTRWPVRSIRLHSVFYFNSSWIATQPAAVRVQIRSMKRKEHVCCTQTWFLSDLGRGESTHLLIPTLCILL